MLNFPSLLTTAYVGAVIGSDFGFCIGCAEVYWPVGSPGLAASHDRGCAAPGWPPGDALVGCCRHLPSAGLGFYPAVPPHFQPDHGHSSSLSGNTREYLSITAVNYILISFKTMLQPYLRDKTAPPPAGTAHVPFSFCELGSGCF